MSIEAKSVCAHLDRSLCLVLLCDSPWLENTLATYSLTHTRARRSSPSSESCRWYRYPQDGTENSSRGGSARKDRIRSHRLRSLVPHPHVMRGGGDSGQWA